MTFEGFDILHRQSLTGSMIVNLIPIIFEILVLWNQVISLVKDPLDHDPVVFFDTFHASLAVVSNAHVLGVHVRRGEKGKRMAACVRRKTRVGKKIAES